MQSKQKNWMRLIALILLVSMLLPACSPKSATPAPASQPTAGAATEAQQPAGETAAAPTEAAQNEQPAAETPTSEPAPTTAPTTRKGGWLDTITFVEEGTAEAAVSRIEAGELDMHAMNVADAAILKQVKDNPDLKYASSSGGSDEITFNPSGPTSKNGKLNPFSDPKIREAMNWLIDRNYIVEEIMNGLGKPKYLLIMDGFPEYVRYLEKARELEAKYAYNPDKAKEVVNKEMEGLGAKLVDGKWQYNNAPVELIGIIRTEDERREIGDYLANQLETIGFTVKRDYKTSAEASPIWNQSDPAEGLWHFYTGGWITKWVLRDESSQFDFMYTKRGMGSALWNAYTPTEEFDKLADRLNRADYSTMDERKQLFERGLELSMEDSARIWVVDEMSFTPMRSDVVVSNDLAAGIQGGSLWPYTLRREGKEGGEMKISNSQILVEPWNPVGGTNFVTDSMIQRATEDRDTLKDPFTGLAQPLRIEKAEVSVKNGSPVTKTLDWVDLKFVDDNKVPEDALVDWNAKDQKFITAKEKFPEGVSAKTKVVVTYPENLYDITWHDGSKFSIADIMMTWILSFDPAKQDSAIYDEAQVSTEEAFLQSFKGWRITSEKPLVIEMYTDVAYPDAEDNVYQWLNWWPTYNYGTGAWHNIGLGILAESNNELAFTADKADAKKIEWLSLISGPSMDVLKKYLDQAVKDNYIPYAPTLGKYITADDAKARWENLSKWYGEHGHFWVGTGPYFIDKVYTTENMVTIKTNPNYIDLADRWSGFSEPMFPEVEVDGPSRVTIGQEATFDVNVTFKDAAYKAADMDQVKFLVFDANGVLLLSDAAKMVEDGKWQITLTAEQTAKLEAGSNKLEVAAASKLVSLPTFASVEFVTVP